MTPEQFNQHPAMNMTRLVNYLYELDMSIIPIGHPGGYPNEAVVRVGAFVKAYQQSRPSTIHTVQWKSLDALRTSIRWYGPTCSDDDIAAAVQALSVQGTGYLPAARYSNVWL